MRGPSTPALKYSPVAVIIVRVASLEDALLLARRKHFVNEERQRDKGGDKVDAHSSGRRREDAYGFSVAVCSDEKDDCCNKCSKGQKYPARQPVV